MFSKVMVARKVIRWKIPNLLSRWFKTQIPSYFTHKKNIRYLLWSSLLSLSLVLMSVHFSSFKTTVIDCYPSFANNFSRYDAINIHVLTFSYRWVTRHCHYSDGIMGKMASQITSLSIVYSTVYSGADQGKHKSSVSLVFVRGPVNSPHKWPVTRKMFPFDDVIMVNIHDNL